MPTVLIIGANGFIGSMLCGRLASGNKVIGVDITSPADEALNIAWEQTNPPTALRSIADRPDRWELNNRYL